MMYHVPDMNNQEAIARFGQAQSLYGRVGAAVAFFEPEILAIGPERLKKMVEEEPGCENTSITSTSWKRGESTPAPPKWRACSPKQPI